MKVLTYEQLIDIIKQENILTAKSAIPVIETLCHQKEDDSQDFGEHDSDIDSRSKLRNLAEMFSNESLTIHADAKDYHNLAVDYARLAIYDCAIMILERGLKAEQFAPDLLADLILYGKESGQLEKSEKAFSNLLLVDKDSWGWRAYSFSIDYQIALLNREPMGAERNRRKRYIHKLANEFVGYSQRDPDSIDRAYSKKAEVIKEIGGVESQESVLLEGLKRTEFSPQCSLRMADLTFKRGDYSSALNYLGKCKLAINDPQPDINPQYVYLLIAMAATSKLMGETPDGDFTGKKAEVEAIYRNFHIAYQAFPLKQQFEDVAKRTIKVLEIQSSIKDKTPDPNENDDEY